MAAGGTHGTGNAMLVYFLDKITCYVDSPRISEFHHDMFHGMGKRQGPNDDRALRWRESDREPLHLVRNGWGIPDVFSANISLIVSQSVKQNLERLRNVEFLQVEFEKVICQQYEPGDFSWYDQDENKDRSMNPEDLFTTLPDVPDLRARLGPYFEVIEPRVMDVAEQYTDLIPVRLELGRAGYEDTVETEISVKMVEDYPILWDGAFILNPQAYNLLGAHLDRDYYAVEPIMLR